MYVSSSYKRGREGASWEGREQAGEQGREGTSWGEGASGEGSEGAKTREERKEGK